ncbi:uncharacterized protein L201_003212 [Kwoniella dendrophila CBS 6074]|uniref:NADH:ubiquinone oxidoreductase intermediate-associated protein 30 domain-containing protein n=1 Tax=Kwoniella dendrophila CBS 6074 TaxID=1295534 RepID=A0AAX4JSN3_9TREE
MSPSEYSVSSSASSLAGRKVKQHTVKLNTTYRDTTETNGKPSGGPHNYSFFEFDVADGTSDEDKKAFFELKNDLQDENGKMNLMRRWTNVLSATDSTQSEKWQGFITDKGLTTQSEEQLIVFKSKDDGRSEINSHGIDRDTKRSMLVGKRKGGSFETQTSKLGLSLNANNDSNEDISVKIAQKIPILYSAKGDDSRYLAMTTKSQNEGGFPGLQSDQPTDWSGELTWWELLPDKEDEQEGVSSKDTSSSIEGNASM